LQAATTLNTPCVPNSSSFAAATTHTVLHRPIQHSTQRSLPHCEGNTTAEEATAIYWLIASGHHTLNAYMDTYNLALGCTHPSLTHSTSSPTPKAHGSAGHQLLTGISPGQPQSGWGWWKNRTCRTHHHGMLCKTPPVLCLEPLQHMICAIPLCCSM
jgi:hypothetical protein